MSLFDKEQSKPHVVIYFSPENGDAMKGLAARLRAHEAKPVETTMVWAKAFGGEVLKAKGIIIEKGCVNEGRIAREYGRILPDCEVHYVTPNGEWYTGEVEAPEPVSVIHTTTTPTPAPVEKADVADTEAGETAQPAVQEAPAPAPAETGDDAAGRDENVPSPLPGGSDSDVDPRIATDSGDAA